MHDHFACVGIDVAASGGVSEAVAALLPSAAETIYRGGGSLFDWRDPSGAGVTVTTVTVDNVVQCVTPTYTAGLRAAARAVSFAEGDHCRFCHPLVVDVLDETGRVAHGLGVRLEDAALTRRRVVPGADITLAFAGLAERVQVWADDAAYVRAHEQQRAPLPLGSIAPTGLYAPTPTPHAIVTGIVQRVEERRNETTGAPFVWTAVAAGAGDVEVVMPPPPDADPPVAAGSVVQALCLVVGRIVDGLGPEPRSFRVTFEETRAGRADARRSQASTASAR